MGISFKRIHWVLSVLTLLVVSFACVSTGQVEQKITQTTPTLAETQVMENSGGDWYEVYFTSPTIPFDYVTIGGIEEHLIDKIDAAQKSIYLAVYEFDLENVAQALIKAKQRDVDVKVVYDDEYTDPDPQMDELIRAGIPSVADNRSTFMHNKFFVFDDECVWTGSFNTSVNAAYRNNENALYFCSPEAVANYTAEFSEMFFQQFGSSSPSDTPYPTFTVDGVLIANYFAPEDDVVEKIIETIKGAQKYIHFMAYSFTKDELGDAMLLEMNKGVYLGGIFESRGANTKYSECQKLLVAGADIYIDGNPRTFHHKVIIVDGTTVIVGSFNFTDNADENNDENLLIIQDETLASAYEEEYQKMKRQAFAPLWGSCTRGENE